MDLYPELCVGLKCVHRPGSQLTYDKAPDKAPYNVITLTCTSQLAPLLQMVGSRTGSPLSTLISLARWHHHQMTCK